MQLKTGNSQKGFTLIEIMVVILIVAGVLAVGGTRLFNPNENRRSQIRKLAIQTKELRTAARLQNATYRIVFEMDDEKGHRYWVESAAGQALQLSEEQEEELEKLTEIQREEALKGRSKFVRDTKYREIALNGGLLIEAVEINGRKEEFTQGRAYVHFFPQGLSDEAIIRLGDRKNQRWSIVIHPLTGAAEVFNRATTLKELKAK